jgi:GrpB-like predicted nucleotidyltransferase (UPF0157 family)
VPDTHPLWRPYDRPTDEEIARATVGTRAALPGNRVEVVAPDPAWPDRYDELATLVRSALGERVLGLEHVGATSVPGLWAKPVVDADLTVADSGDEPAYLADLEAAGFVLRVREPDWEEHRCLRLEAPPGNLHVFSPGAVEPRRHRAFRDWLTVDDTDRERYGALKRDLASRPFESVMAYNNEKGVLIYEIYERIFAADRAHPHTPRPIEPPADAPTGRPGGPTAG